MGMRDLIPDFVLFSFKWFLDDCLACIKSVAGGLAARAADNVVFGLICNTAPIVISPNLIVTALPTVNTAKKKLDFFTGEPVYCSRGPLDRI